MIPGENGAKCVRKSFHIFDLFPNGAIVLNIPYISPFLSARLSGKQTTLCYLTLPKEIQKKIPTFHFN